ncbi:hypothetical protein ANCCEY_11049 [Ancylostoma ceylanicum]|uniref:Major facilitator superfamily (MFS) profile domain-containing protein n=1 Tax=Ancylostoma ceylanicum TaxID=53326 RepID=A0A0D6LCQ0_9BILA|nr:hypothetical protein ANCCEY_11049 [Ancylostoma ceylanicum]
MKRLSIRAPQTTRSGVALSFWTIKHSFFAFFVTYGLLFGLGQGIAYVTAVATVINWAPDKVGLASGIVAAGFGVSSSIFAPIQTRLINPKNLPYFLDKDLLLRVPDVFLTLSAVYAIMQLIGLIVVCDPPEKMRSSGLGSVSEYLRGMRHGRRANPRQRFSAVLYKQLPREEITVLGRKLHAPDRGPVTCVFVNKNMLLSEWS